MSDREFRGGSGRRSRREFFGVSAAAGVGLLGLNAIGTARAEAKAKEKEKGKGKGPMKAGFSRASITPPVGTTMMGFGGRDLDHGCEGIHDDIYVRALFLEHEGEQALIMGFDLCFLGREDADRLKGAIGRRMDLEPRQILLNTSHNHVGPSVGTWYSAGYEMPDRLYLNDLEAATVKAACEAFENRRPVTMSAGVTTSKIPMNRRRKMPDGKIENRPNPDKKPYDRLPICLFNDETGKPVCLLFSISSHPSMMNGWEISAEYPGAAMKKLDEHFGTTCSLFLQGVAGDAKPWVIGRGGVDAWQPGTWELMDEAGSIIANEVIEALNKGFDEVKPMLQSATTEMTWALQPTPPRSEFEAVVAATPEENRAKDVKYMWAAQQLKKLDRGDTLPTSVTLTAHGVTLGKGLRIFAFEGEAVGDWGYFIEPLYEGGVTFPIGYTDGQGLYLPTSVMVPEGGYEASSAWEYGLPSNLAAGMEDEVKKAFEELKGRGIL